MANEKRLIDANALMEDAKRCRPILACLADIVDIEWLVKDQPTVDAVEVVRCKDCKHISTASWGEKFCVRKRIDGVYVELSNLRADDFCSYGERKDGDQS